MLQPGGQHVGVDLVVVAALAVVPVGVHPWARAAASVQGRQVVAVQPDRGQAAVRPIVLLDVEEGQGGARRRAQAKAHRWRDAPAVIGNRVAARHAAVLAHHVQAHGTVGTDTAIDVAGNPLLAGRAQTQRGIAKVVRLRLLAGQIDVAGGRASADVGAGGPFDHVDLLNVEHVARDRADVAHTVHEDASGSVVPAHVDGVARGGVAVFAHLEGDAGRIAQGLGQAADALVLQHFLADHRDGLRCVHQRRRHLGRCCLLGFVAGVWRGLDLDLGQGGGGAGLRLHGRDQGRERCGGEHGGSRCAA